jgi:vacuolar-type H+-ATPase subunit H
MVQEMIQAIRQAEINAEQTEKAAHSESESILLEAQAQADKIVADLTDQAKAAAEEAMQQAQEQGEKIMKDALGNVDTEIEILKKSATANETKAIDAILDSLI